MNEFLNQVLDIIKSTKDFVLDQAPDICRQFILVARIETTLSFVVWGGSCLAYFWVFKTVKHLTGSETDYADRWDEATWICPMILGVCLLIYTGAQFTCVLHTTITVWFAPKIYLIEHLAEIMKGK